MTKGKFVELIMNRLGWKFGNRTIELHIENAWTQVIGQLFLNDAHQLDLYSKVYDEVAVVHSSPRPYALLPVKSIQYKDVGGGVRQINTLCDENLYFAPMRSIDFQLFSELDAGTVNTDVVGYLTRTDRVEFFDMADSITSVRMYIVPAFSAWSDDEDMPMPSGVSENIYGLVVQAVQGNVPTDNNIFKDQVPLADVKD